MSTKRSNVIVVVLFVVIMLSAFLILFQRDNHSGGLPEFTNQSSAEQITEPRRESAHKPTKVNPSSTDKLAGDKRSNLNFRIIDEASAPIKGASVYNETDGLTTQLLGRSTASGVVGVDFGEGQETYIFSAVGFQPRSQSFPRTGEYEIVMKKGCQISGVVVDANDRPVEGATVVAISCDFRQHAHKSLKASKRHPLAHHVKTGQDGGFVINSLPERGFFDIAAGKAGASGKARRVGLDTHIKLKLQPLFELTIELVDDNGAKILTSPRLQTSSNFLVYNFGKYSRNVSYRNSADTLVAGAVEEPILEKNVGHMGAFGAEFWDGGDKDRKPRRYSWWFRTDEKSNKIGPLHVKISVPGYEPTSGDFAAYRVVPDRPRRIQRMKLKQRCDGFAKLSVRFITAVSESNMRELGQNSGIGYIELFNVATEESIRLRIWSVSGEAIVIDKVPSGSYLWRFVANGGLLISANSKEDIGELTLVPGSNHELTIDNVNWCVLAIKDPNGMDLGLEYMRRNGLEKLILAIVREDGRNFSQEFSGASVKLDILGPGEYRMNLFGKPSDGKPTFSIYETEFSATAGKRIMIHLEGK